MRKVLLNIEQATFLIDFIKESMDSMNMDDRLNDSKKFIQLLQLHDLLTGYYKPNENQIPNESLRGNDSCSTGKCD